MAIYFVKDTRLKSLADSTRTLSGATGSLSTKTMNDKLDEVASAIEDAKDAITGKGVSVPSGTTALGLAALISSITAGGGDSGGSGGGSAPAGIVSKSGSFKTTTDSNYVLTHNLGVTPNLIYINHNASDAPSNFFYGIGVSSHFKDPSQSNNMLQWVGYFNENAPNDPYQTGGAFGIDENANALAPIRNANAETITLGSSFIQITSGIWYKYTIIGGLFS